MRFALVENHHLAREAFAKQFPKIVPWLELKGTFKNGRDAVENLDFDSIDLLITDLEMEEMDGEALVHHTRVNHPRVKTIILSVHDTPNDIQLVRDAGANGYIVKSDDLDIIARTFEDVKRLGFGAFVCHNEAADEIRIQLTQTEERIISLISKGFNSKEIADFVELSPRSVEGYRKKICDKFGVTNSPEMIAEAIRLRYLKA